MFRNRTSNGTCYWHVPLDEASSYMTTFNTPFGRYHFTRLPFGVVVSQDVFQKYLGSALEGLKGISGIDDDTFVYGVEHDTSMVNLMIRSREREESNSTKTKCSSKVRKFFEQKWIRDGIKPDDSKIPPIQEDDPTREPQRPSKLFRPCKLPHKILRAIGLPHSTIA